MSLQRYEAPPTREWIALLPSAAELSKAVANTEFVPKTLRGNPAAITACVLYGDEVGLGPMQSLAHISVIDGRPSMSAEAMRGLILAAGHDLWIEDATTTRATVAGRRKESDQTSRVTWTMDDAKRANLVGKDNWRKYPRAMLIARATAELARSVFADAIRGLVATEELDGELAESAPTGATETPAGEGNRRRRRTTLAPVSAAPTEPAAAPVAAERPPLPGEATVEPGSPQSATGEGLDEAPPPSTVADNEALRKRLMAGFRERGFTEREPRLAFARFVVGRAVESSNDLTTEEASRIIDALESGHALAE